ncbi:hypothetical protein PIB30_072225, partial [Stylosanthes scabra]|nr:hypothetical protein [Stylosanthes scabra]
KIKRSRCMAEEGRDDNDWKKLEREVHTMFVDGLPDRVTKRALYREFGLSGNVVDVYISWKQIRGVSCPFAFVRYDAKGGALRAIERKNGSSWEGRRILVKTADFRRMGRDQRVQNPRMKSNVRNEGMPENRNRRHDTILQTNDGDGVCVAGCHRPEPKKAKRVVHVLPSLEQNDLLDRSALRESFQPIKFGNLVVNLENHWDEYGKIEVRDIGPCKCIITFESVHECDKALENGLLLNYVDEARAYWGFKWSHSQRVWLELMRVPIHAWSKDTFDKMAKALDGKLITPHFLTGEKASFSVARILIDYYQWEPIQ